MFTADRMTWVGKLSDGGRWALCPFTTKDGGDQKFYMNHFSHAVYVAEKVLLDLLSDPTTSREKLIDAIVSYGETTADLARRDEMDRLADSSW